VQGERLGTRRDWAKRQGALTRPGPRHQERQGGHRGASPAFSLQGGCLAA